MNQKLFNKITQEEIGMDILINKSSMSYINKSMN